MEALTFGAYGRSFAGSVGGFGGLNFGSVPTAAPPKPTGWTTGGEPGSAWVPSTGISAIPNYPGWVRQLGGLKVPSAEVGGETMFAWALCYATTDGVTTQWYVKYAPTQPGFPKVPAPATGAVTPSTDTPVMQLQKALNMADAYGKDGKQLVVDGAPGPNTCWACYKYQGEIASLPTQPLLSAEFFAYLGLPGSFAKNIGNVCTPYYTGPTDAPPVSGPPAIITVDPAPVSEPEPDIRARAENKAGIPWWLGLIAAVVLVGGAVVMKKKKKKKKSKKKKRR